MRIVIPRNKMKKNPVLIGKIAIYPNKAVCPWCKKKKVFEPHTFVILSGGSLSKDSNKSYSAPTKELKGFLYLLWHGAHDSGEGDKRDTGIIYPLANEVEGGYFNIYFCSVKCLREYLNYSLDEFENKVKKLKKVV
jgi:hypothetical protein